MRLSRSSEHAIRCLVFMAQRDGKVCSVKTLSDALGIPYKFLGRLMSRLGSAGVVIARHGKGGGYRIARPLREVTLADVVEVVEGLESYERCILGFATCDDAHPCPLHERWHGPRESIRNMLDGTTLADLAVNGCRRL